MPDAPARADLEHWHRLGVGRLLVLHVGEDGVYVGRLVYNQGRLQLQCEYPRPGERLDCFPCSWKRDFVGAIARAKGKPWNDLSFLGVQNCIRESDITEQDRRTLGEIRNAYGDRLLDFEGSMYRGYQLLLENRYLPVVVLREIRLPDGEPALPVFNFRGGGSEAIRLRQYLSDAVARRLTLTLDEVSLPAEEFDRLFGRSS